MTERPAFIGWGLRLRYTDMGEGTPIVWLHGAMMEAETYRQPLELLAKTHRVIAPDLPGFGDSPAPPEVWRFEDYAEFLSQFITHLELKEVAAMGHSFGGGVAAHLAGINPEITALVLVDPAGVSDKSWGHFNAAAVKKAMRGSENRQRARKVATDFFTLWVRKHYQELPLVIEIVRRAVVQTSLSLPEIKVPTLILWGDKDEVLDPALGQEWQKAIPGAKLQIVPGNHDWCILKPWLLVKEVDNFLLPGANRSTSNKIQEASDR